MGMTVSAIKDAVKWLEEIANRGIVEFKYRDLPDELKNRKLLYKAMNSDLIVSHKKDKDISIWSISDDGRKRIKTFKEQNDHIK